MTTRSRAGVSVGAMLLLAVSLVAPTLVAAHAELETTDPAAETTIEGTPAEISATFSEGLEPDAALSLRDGGGSEIASGGLDPEDPTRIVIAPVPELAPGSYEVRWTSVTADGHVERDTWTFTVTAAPTPSPSPAPSVAPSATAEPTPSPNPVPSPTVAPSPSADGGGPAGSGNDVILPILLGLALVGLVAGFLVTRRGRPTPPA